MTLGLGNRQIFAGMVWWLCGSLGWKNGMPVGPKVPWARSGFGGGHGMAILGIRDWVPVRSFFPFGPRTRGGIQAEPFSVNWGPADAGLTPSSCREKGYA